MTYNNVGGLREYEDNQGDEDADHGRDCLYVFAIGHNVVTKDDDQHSGRQCKGEEPEVLEDGAHGLTHEIAGYLAAHAKHVGDLVVDAKEVLHAAFDSDDDAKGEEHRGYDDAGDGLAGNDDRDKPEKRTCCQAGCKDTQEAQAKKGATGVCDAQETFKEKKSAA